MISPGADRTAAGPDVDKLESVSAFAPDGVDLHLCASHRNGRLPDAASVRRPSLMWFQRRGAHFHWGRALNEGGGVCLQHAGPDSLFTTNGEKTAVTGVM